MCVCVCVCCVCVVCVRVCALCCLMLGIFCLCRISNGQLRDDIGVVPLGDVAAFLSHSLSRLKG
jgi:hypothetical protein